ncbi:MAG TPA: zinc-dependent metalloprotease, partial [Burkholderiaceae bacterium]|nr:zinc-dependent metalloprotease [Burkholderiaceae bacterium]
IAARADQPALAFATDGDVYDGLDPLVNQNDLGADPLAYYRKRVQLSRELWQDLETRRLRPGESYEVLRRRFMTGFSQVAMAMGLTAKYVAGVTTYNDKAGSSRPPVVPVSAARQREAIGLLADALFRADSFRVPPQFLNKLIYDRLDVEAGGAPRADLPVADMVLNVQRDVLNRLMSPTVAQRTLNNLFKIGNAKEAMTLGELYGTLQSAIWSEARQGLESDVLRRNLQREHLSRVAAALLGRSGIMPADARALLRANARELRDQLGVAAKRRNLSVETRAHYAESFETLDEALKAPLERASP